MTLNEIIEIVKEEDFDVTLSGGDPLMHPEAVAELVRAIRKTGHTVWIYTGYRWEEILADPRLLSAVREAETVVDGRFEQSLRDPELLFRGSSNQRLIDVASSLSEIRKSKSLSTKKF